LPSLPFAAMRHRVPDVDFEKVRLFLEN